MIVRAHVGIHRLMSNFMYTLQMLMIPVITRYISAFNFQKEKRKNNYYNGKRNQLLILKTNVETITSLFVTIVMILKLQA